MKKFFTALLAALIFSSTLVSYQAVSNVSSVDGYFTYEVVDGSARIISCDKNITGSLVIPETLGGVKVTHIKNSAFSSCKISSVTIPDSVISIGANAFIFCNDLLTVNIGSSVSEIGVNGVNYYSPNIEEYTVAADNPFFESVNGVLFNEDISMLIAYPVGRASTEYIIPDTVKRVEKRAFQKCDTIKKIVLPEELEYIGDYAFMSAINLRDIEIPSTVTFLGEYAFYDTSISLIEIPQGISEIKALTFYSCENLSTVILHHGLTSIGLNAFYGCNIRDLILPTSVTHIATLAFSSSTALKKVVIGTGSTSVYSRNVLSANATTTNIVAEAAFENCSGLSTLIILDGVNEIGSRAFSGCYNLKDITIPATVTKLGDGAFKDCNRDAVVTFGGDRNEWNSLINASNAPALNEKTVIFTPIEYKLGDANSDEQIDIRDIVCMKKYILSIKVCIAVNSVDYDSNGKVDINDIVMLKKSMIK